MRSASPLRWKHDFRGAVAARGRRPGVLVQRPRHVGRVDRRRPAPGGRSAARGHAAPPALGAPHGRERCGPHLRADPSVSLGSPSGAALGDGGARRGALERDVRPRAARRRQQRIVRGHDAFGVPSGGAAAYRRAQGPSHRVVFRPGAAGYDVYVRYRHRGAEPDDHGVARASVSVLARLVGWVGDRLRVRHRADAGRERRRATPPVGETSPADAPGHDLGRRRERAAAPPPCPARERSRVRRPFVAGGAGRDGDRRHPAGAHAWEGFQRLLESDAAVRFDHAA